MAVRAGRLQGTPLVSVVIPARQAAGTLAETLESLRSQTLPRWEAVIVDDGSTDPTILVAERVARRDTRFRVVVGPHVGVSAARNRGLAEARAPWVLFLDADDWLEPTHLERTTAATGPGIGAVLCGWARVAADGTRAEGIMPPPVDDPFAAFGARCSIPVHACVVRRDLIEEVGAFDPSLVTCEDWDLWQRVTRSGARFAAVPEILAFYRMRQGSATADASRLVADGFEVLRRTHAPDPRVRGGGRYAVGLPTDELPRERLLFITWVAGLVAGNGEDPSPLVEAVGGAPLEGNGYLLALALFEAVPVGAATTARAWSQLWPSVAAPLSSFVDALEQRSPGSGLAPEVRSSLERLVVDAVDQRPLTIGRTHAVRIEVTQPLSDMWTPTDTDRLRVDVDVEGKPLGMVELPVVNGRVTAAVLADAVAAAHAWPILGRFFARTVYDTTTDDPEARHDEIGWTVLLRELWDRPTWEPGSFYDATTPDDRGTLAQPSGGWLVVEVADELPSVGSDAGDLLTVVEVGGARVGVVALQAGESGLSAQELRVAITSTCGFELCIAAVREGVLGSPLVGSLRERLSAAGRDKKHGDAAGLPVGVAPNSERIVAEAIGTHLPSLVLAAHRGGVVGSAASRRAIVPSAAAPALSQLAACASQPSLQWPAGSHDPVRVVYAPDLLWNGAATAVEAPPAHQAERNMRHEFETCFAAQTDPWRYSSNYEQVKYAQTLRLLPRRRPRSALEIGCAEGHFTELLARRVGRLVAVDISGVALRRARKRCEGVGHIEFRQLDLSTDPLPGAYDLIVCSETLYYTADRAGLAAIAAKLTEGLSAGGHLLMAHAHAVVDEPDQPGFDWHVPFGAAYIAATFAAAPGLRLVRELRTPMYRIQLYRRDRARNGIFGSPRNPRLENQPVTSPLDPDVAAHFLPSGGVPPEPPPPPMTDRLPILMYHRVATSGVPGLARYRVTAAAFDEQLAYLRDAGFRGVTLEEWGDALRRRQPLAGRCVLFTFDDGYVDFLTDAWPLLRRYGFPATLFVVAGQVGGTNTWDRAHGESVPLLDWPALRDLRDDGVHVGAHGLFHRRLAGLSPSDIAAEGASARAVLEEHLQEPVTAAAYPYDSHDPVVAHLFGGCGYCYGLTCKPGRSSLLEHPLSLPRVEIFGSDDLSSFIARLGDLPVTLRDR